jgi:hypothetical protein
LHRLDNGRWHLNWITPLEAPVPVHAPLGLIYSTGPRELTATDGNAYIIKGPEPSLVFAEYAAYELAAIVGVPVPEHALCMLPGDGGDVYFASRKKRLRLDPTGSWAHGVVANREMLSTTAAFDVWIANTDRNLGNIVGEPLGSDGQVQWFAIDFERAESLRGRLDLFAVMGIDPRRMHPHEQLGVFCRSGPIPLATCERIADSASSVIEIIGEWEADLLLPRIDWAERSATVLRQRAHRIHSLVQEAWA